MKKPQKYLPKEIYRYNLLDVLNYMETKYSSFTTDDIWGKLCDYYGYFNNDTSIYIDFDEIFSNYKDDDNIQKELKLLYEEFPDLKNNDFLFDISW